MHGNVGQSFTIQFNPGLFETVHELAVAQIILAGSGINPGNPQGAKVSLAVAAVAVGIYQRLHHGFVAAFE